MSGKLRKALFFCVAFCVATPPATAQVLNMTVGRENNDSQLSRVLPNYSFIHNRQERSVIIQNENRQARAFMRLLKPIPYVKSTRDYALHIMKEVKGEDLQAQEKRRGYSFRYKEQDKVPCAAVISYFDGISYLMYGACGFIDMNEIAQAFIVAQRALVLDEQLYRTSLPTIYY